MRTRYLRLALWALGLTLGPVPGLITASSAQTGDYPYQAQSLVADGVLSSVDAGRDRATFTTDDGRHLTLDMSQAAITLLTGSQAGNTGDLLSGMRVHVLGRLLSAGIAEVDQMRVLPVPPSSGVRPAEIELRGTVDSIDTQNGSFVVHVNDHTRTILLADNTDLSGLGRLDPNRFPVKPGDRVTVAGMLEPDGSVLAGAISLSRTVSLPHPIPPAGGPVISASLPRIPTLVGRVSAPSNQYTSRDIKIRLTTNDHEVKVKVPRSIPIQSHGRTISVHDLRENDEVRVTGTYDGSDFEATRIDVLRSANSSSVPLLGR